MTNVIVNVLRPCTGNLKATKAYRQSTSATIIDYVRVIHLSWLITRQLWTPSQRKQASMLYFANVLRSFGSVGPKLWNSLPDDITSASSLSVFRKKLKTHLFQQSYPDIIL